MAITVHAQTVKIVGANGQISLGKQLFLSYSEFVWLSVFSLLSTLLAGLIIAIAHLEVLMVDSIYRLKLNRAKRSPTTVSPPRRQQPHM